jgi:hypothetical protein
MAKKITLRALFLTTIFMLAASVFTGCSSQSIPTTPQSSPGVPGGGAIVNSDSIITAKIQAIRPQTTGYPWELDILILDSVSVGSLPNPTKDSIGKVVTVKTDQDIFSFKVNDSVTAKVKYVGDVPKPGITLYVYNIALLEPPK